MNTEAKLIINGRRAKKGIFRHINPNSSPTMYAFGVQNPLKKLVINGRSAKKIIFHHINTNWSPAMYAFGVQNPLKVADHRNNHTNCHELPAPSHSCNLRYTNNTGKLTHHQRLIYEENGFVVIPKLVPPECLERYERRFRDVCEKRIDASGMTVMKEISYRKHNLSEKVVYKIKDFAGDDVLFGYCKLPEILDLVESFCGPNIKAMTAMLINKPPDSGSLASRHPIHQDLYFLPFRPADKIVGVWTAIEKASRENGCLSVIPGSHKGPLLVHHYPDWEGGVNQTYHGITELGENDMNQRIHLEMEPGDTVFFHPLLFHGSGSNRTKGFRKAISCHYAAADSHYINLKGTIQENIENEMVHVERRKGRNVNHLKDFYQARGRLVRGKEVTL